MSCRKVQAACPKRQMHEQQTKQETVKKPRHVIVFSGSIDEEHYNAILNGLNNYMINKDNYSGITIFITSLGGEAYYALAIYDFIKSLNVDIYTVALGACASAATIIFALGKRRFVSENAIFLIHNARIQYSNLVTMRDIGYLKDTINSVDEKLISMMKQCIQNEEFEKRLADTFTNVKEDYITVEELLKYGIATEKLTDFNSVT